MAHEVFISYAVEDGRVAEKVCRVLEGESIRCWMAPRDVPYGADYEEAIVDAISTSRLLVLILSAHSNASPHVKREIQNACAEGSATEIIPLRIDDVPYSKALRYYLGSAQWLDASTPPLESHLRRLVEHVRKRLPPRPNIPPPPEPPLPVYRQEPVTGETGGGRRSFPLAWLALGAGALLLAGVVTIIAVVSYSTSGNGNETVSRGEPPVPVNAGPTETPTPLTQPNVNAAAPAPNSGNSAVNNTSGTNGNGGANTPPAAGTPTPPPPTPTATPTPRPITDKEIEDRIYAKLSAHDGLKPVEVQVKGGVVLLQGEAYSESCVKLADYYGRSTKGVARVVNKVRVADWVKISCPDPPPRRVSP